MTISAVQYCGAGFSLPGRDSSRPLFFAPTEHLGMSAEAAGKSARQSCLMPRTICKPFYVGVVAIDACCPWEFGVSPYEEAELPIMLAGRDRLGYTDSDSGCAD